MQSNYQKLVKAYLEAGKDVPPKDVVAKELGVTVNRLKTALRSTQQILSLDEPFSENLSARVGSGAGGDSFGQTTCLSDTIQR